MTIHRSRVPVGPDIITPELEDVFAALEAAPRGDDWPAVSKLIVPVIPRVRPQPPGSPPPLRALLPPGVTVSFGVDIGPAFMAVSRDQLDVLGITEPQLVAQALANLVERAARVEPDSVNHQLVDGVDIAALQTGLSIASTLILVPEQLGRLFGHDSRIFLSPMRDVLLGFPVDVEPAIAGDIYELLASQDPNCLAPNAYRFDGRSVTPVNLGVDAPMLQRLLA